MSQATYYFLSTGGVGFTPDGTIPMNAVLCTEAQYQNPGNYFIDDSTDPPTIQSISMGSLLQLAQSSQIMLLQQECQNSIFSGYSSNALGSPHLYPAKTTDQMNMISSLMSAVCAVVFDADDWEPNTLVVEGQLVWYKKQLYEVVVNGETGDSMPRWPTVTGATVADGTTAWTLWYTPFWCADQSTTPPTWGWRVHNLRQLWQAGKDAKSSILNDMETNAVLSAEVEAASTISSVEAIQWP